MDIAEIINVLNEISGLNAYGDDTYIVVKEVTNGSQRIAEITTDPLGFQGQQTGAGDVWVAARRAADDNPNWINGEYVSVGRTGVEEAVEEVRRIQTEYLNQPFSSFDFETNVATDLRGNVYTPEELSACFEIVANGNNWKRPISALVSPAAVDGVRAAIEFFTGSIAAVWPEYPGYRVEAAGYYAAIGV